MEAGVEHFGRGIDACIDTILGVVEPSMESVAIAEKIRDLTAGIEKSFKAVLNKIDTPSVSAELEEILKEKSIEVTGIIPYDPIIRETCFKGRALARDKAYRAAEKILTGLLPKTNQ